MIGNNAIRNIIREDRVLELPRNMGLSSKEEGMQTMDQALADLVERNVVTLEEALMKNSDPVKLNQLLQPCTADALC
jgi:twitching motility protein PilT